MSGVKKTPLQIAEENIRDLKKEVRRVEEQAKRSAREAVEQANKQHQQDVNRLRQENEEKEKRIQQQLTNTYSEFAQSVANIRQDMQTNKHEFDNALENQKAAVTDLKQWTKQALKDQNDKFDRISEKQQKQLNKVRQDIDGVLVREGGDDRKAQKLLQELELTLDIFERELPHLKYAPDKVSRLKNRLHSIRNSGDRGQAQIANIRQTMFDLIDLQEDIEKARLQFEALHITVLNAANALLAKMQSNRENIRFSTEDSQDGARVEINYWTYDAYEALQKEAISLKNDLETRKDEHDFSQNDINEILKRLCEIEVEQTALVELAIERGNASHIRAEMADIVVENLERQSFKIVYSDEAEQRGYIKGDQREGYYVLFKNDEGTEVSVLIHPGANTISNELIINTKNARYFNESDAYDRVKDINAVLYEAGLDIGQIEAPKDLSGHVEELFDINALRRQGISDKTKQELKLSAPEKTKKSF